MQYWTVALRESQIENEKEIREVIVYMSCKWRMLEICQCSRSFQGTQDYASEISIVLC